MANDAKSQREAFILAEVERALAPYVGIAPPGLLQTMREGLEEALRTNPIAEGLIDQLAERPAPQRSDDLPRGGAGSADTIDKVKKA